MSELMEQQALGSTGLAEINSVRTISYGMDTAVPTTIVTPGLEVDIEVWQSQISFVEAIDGPVSELVFITPTAMHHQAGLGFIDADNPTRG